MDKWIIAQTVDLDTGQITVTSGQIPHPHKGDKGSIRWLVTVTKSGQSVNLSGCTAFAYANRIDKSTSLASCEISGNAISVDMPAQFFAFVGKVNVLMSLTSNGDTMTVSELWFDVKQGPYDVVVDPGETIPNLSAGLAAIELLSGYTMERATIPNTVECKHTTGTTYTITFADGSLYTVNADGENITIT